MTEAELVLFDDTAPAWEGAFYAFLAEKERRPDLGRRGPTRSCLENALDALSVYPHRV